MNLDDVIHYVPRRHRGRGISLCVPFRADTRDRQLIWDWLKAYYEYHMPEAELVVGTDDGMPFSKTCALNDAASRATGDILVMLDADAWMDTLVIEHAARQIREARDHGRRLWLIPYRRALRLTSEATVELIEHRLPQWPFELPDRHLCEEGWGWYGEDNTNACHYAALVTVMPREAFEAIGGFDPRFRSWGGEDVSTGWALDTLYAKHRTLDATVATLGHEMLGERYHRRWVGGKSDNNDWLGARYRRCWGDVRAMRALVAEYAEITFEWENEGGSPE